MENIFEKKELANAVYSAYCKAEKYLLSKCSELNEDLEIQATTYHGYITSHLYICPNKSPQVFLHYKGSFENITSKGINGTDFPFVDGAWALDGVMDDRHKYDGLNAMKAVIDNWEQIKKTVEVSIEENKISKYKNFEAKTCNSQDIDHINSFIEEYFPDYYHSDDILLLDDLHKMVDGEDISIEGRSNADDYVLQFHTSTTPETYRDSLCRITTQVFSIAYENYIKQLYGDK